MWNLYQNNQFLKPLVFSNGKSQEDIVKEVLKEIQKGNKIIFIHGICGTGKSAIALNIANRLGKTSIIVPIKNLQEQYKQDYEKDKYLKKENNEKLKIKVITGRNNHKCKFLQDNQNAIPRIKQETDSNLHDIFSGKSEEIDNLIGDDISADNHNIPCKIEIKERNWQKIKKYLTQNKDVNIKNFSTLKDVKRVSVAGVCPYWSPSIPTKYELGGTSFTNSIKKKYMGLNDTEFTIYKRRPGCAFYEQFNSYLNADVIIFNAQKYKLESGLNRKPATEAEIIDEGDEFLDKFSNQKTLNIERLQNTLIKTISLDQEMEEIIQELSEIVKQIKRNKQVRESLYSQLILPLKSTGIYDLIRVALKHEDFFYGLDEESYLFDLLETAKTFEEFLEDTYITFNKKDENIIASLVTTNLEKRFKQMIDKNKIIILMSGTLHSKEVMENIFGLKDYKVIDAETTHQGQIKILKTCDEEDCAYRNFSNGKMSREKYLRTLSKCLDISKKPTLVHVNAFADLPSRIELQEFNLTNLISREELREVQQQDKTGELIKKFKNKDVDILFSTRASRGMDFPGEQCNSIVFTKYPYPNVQDAFWKILAKTNPSYYWQFYKDKAQRELWQKVYRGLRSKTDSVFVLSPDKRVLDFFEQTSQPFLQ